MGRTVHPGMKRSRRNEQRTPPALAAMGWSAASFRISTADGWLEVDGIVRPPFGIDQRATDETGNVSNRNRGSAPGDWQGVGGESPLR